MQGQSLQDNSSSEEKSVQENGIEDAEENDSSAFISFLPNSPEMRVDTIAIKNAIKEHLLPNEANLYWATLVDLLTGKITQQEWEIEGLSILRGKPETLRLHNALVLGLLYNTTQTQLPPRTKNTSWSKRRLEKDALGNEVAPDPKRARLRDIVYSLGPKERSKIKALPAANNARLVLGMPPVVYPSEDSLFRGCEVPKPKVVSAAMQQEIQRWQQAPLCTESRELPDIGHLRDRMSYIAYECGLTGGADDTVAQFASVALEAYLKNIIAKILNIAQNETGRATTEDTPTLGDAMDVDGQEEEQEQAAKIARRRAKWRRDAEKNPISLRNMSAFLDICRNETMRPHMGAIERLISTSRLYGGEDEEESDPGMSEERPQTTSPDEETPGSNLPVVTNANGTGSINGTNTALRSTTSWSSSNGAAKSGKPLVRRKLFENTTKLNGTGSLSENRGDQGNGGDDRLATSGNSQRESFLVEANGQQRLGGKVGHPRLQRWYTISSQTSGKDNKENDKNGSAIRRVQSTTSLVARGAMDEERQRNEALENELFPDKKGSEDKGGGDRSTDGEEGGSDSDDNNSKPTKSISSKRKSISGTAQEFLAGNEGSEKSSKKNSKVKKDGWKMDVVDPFRLFRGVLDH